MVKKFVINVEKLSDTEQVGLLKAVYDFVSNDKNVGHAKIVEVGLVRWKLSVSFVVVK